MQLLALLASRHKDTLTRADHERFTLDERFSNLPEVADNVCWVQAGNPDIRETAAQAPRAHPLLTAGVMAAWLGPGGAGRSLVALVIELFRTAVGESQRQRREETPTLAALFTASLLGDAVQSLSRTPLSPQADRLLRGAAQTGLYLAARTALERVQREVNLGAEVGTRVEAIIDPLALLGGRHGVTGSGTTLYGCELSAGLPYFDDALSRMAQGSTADVVQVRLCEALAADPDVGRRAEQAVATALLRERFLAAATLVDQGYLPRESCRVFRDDATLPFRLAALHDDEGERKRLLKETQERATSGGRAMADGLLPLGDALRRYTPKSPASAFGLSREAALGAYARAVVAALCDHWTDRTLRPCFRALERRTGLEAEGGNEAEYAAGRLYRVSAARQPLLREAVATKVGHLFADVKDFTRRTSLVGEAAMGDLLRREFYQPVIAAAKQHHTPHGPLPSGNLAINNLLGDAISLSGTLVGLLTLARSLRQHLGAYERQLGAAVSREAVAKAVAEIEARLLERLSQHPGPDEAHGSERSARRPWAARGERAWRPASSSRLARRPWW